MASIAAVSADDGNMTIGEGDIQHNTIHVSNGGRDDNSGDEQSPYATLGHAVSSSPANSTIILHEGTYKGILNTQININGNLTIEGEGNAIIDGENRFSFFKISSSACLTLKNIKFVNGFTDSYSQLAIINNNGNLKISDCSFDKMNSVMGTIFNQKNLDVVNTTITNSKSKNMAQVIVNLGECTIIDSKLTTSLVYSNQDVSSTVYNYRNLNIHNSRVDEIESNSKYDDFSYTGANIFIDGASIDLLEVEEAAVSLSNSRLANRAGFRNSQVNISKSQFNQQSSYSIGLSVYYCNFTAIHSTFSCDISSGYSNLNITYCAILANMYGGGKYDYLYAPYNWWGINSGPSLSYFNNYNVSYWAVATFEYENASIPINPTGEFTVTLNRWSDGVNTYGFSADEYLPLRYVSFESQSGKFASSYKALDKITNNYLIGNTVDGKVYAVIDRQRLVLNVGNAISEYTYYLSPDGHDGPEDGTYEKPFLTLQYALSRVGNGNTLCILGGINKNPADSDVTITKNITIIGFNDTVLVRSNSFSMFNIKEWGSLTIKNIHFTVSDREYDNPIFLVSGGNLRIVNSTFTNITSAGVVYTSGGIENRGTVVIEDSRFSDIKGSAISGVAKSFIINTSFERFTNYYTIVGLESYNCIFPVTSPIEIYDSTFKNNQIGIVNLHPYYYSRSALLGVPLDYADEYGLYAYVENSLFENNVFAGSDSYSSSGTGFLIHDDYGSFSGFINNCSFIGNQGPICIANSVSNSIFIENTDPTYRSSALVRAGEIYDCRFTKNTNLHKDGDGAFVGEGIASANSILNSTFEYNRAAFGGAVANTFEIHYCAFVNNTALYGGNDIFSASGNVDYSTNWWGDNQKPGSDKIYKFLGTLTVSDWIIMSVEYSSNKQIRASLTRCVDDYGNIRQISNFNQKRLVLFEIDNGEISPENITMNNGVAYAVLNCNFNNDFKAYARIDNQLMEVNVRNTHTDIIADDVTFKGRDNRYSITLQNVNGFKISNQTLLVEVSDETSAKTFTLSTDDNGHAEFNVDYPVGKYSVEVKYLGNGYFTKSSASAIIEIVISPTILVSYNHTYYGKTNRFSAILTGENDNKLRNLTLTFTVFNSNGQLRVINVVTDNYGVGEALLTLDTGEYTVLSEFRGNSWYSYSNATSHIVINPANTTIVVPSITLYGEGNLYNITLKDVYGNRIRDENVFVTITQGAINDRFTLKTNELGVASLTINYLPGTYNIQVEYMGDEVYGSSLSTGIIKIEKVLTVLSGFYHATIPVNGIYTVVLSDMYGKRINGETITLSLYQGELVKQYSQTCDANGEASFRIDMGEGNYLATMDYGGSLWYEDSTGAATIVVSNDVAPQDIFINASDLVQYYGENKFFIIRFNDPNAYSQYGKTITATLSSGTWSSTYNLNTDVYGLARLKITLNPGEYDITYKYSNTYYNLFASGSNKISVFKTPTRIFANDLVIKKDESRILDIGLRDVNNSPIRNMQILVDIDGKISQNLTTNTEGIAKLLLNLDVGEHIVSYSISNPNYLPSNGSSRVLVVDSDKISSNIISHDAVSFDNQTLDFKIQLTDELNVGISSSRVMIGVFDFDGESILNKTGFTSSDGNLTFNLNLGYGSYLVNVAYEGNDLYLPSSNVNTVIVESADNKTKTVLLKGEDQLLSSTDYYVVLSDVNGTLLKNKEIRFILDGREYITATDANARAYLNVTLAPDVYTVKAVFDGDDDYKRSSVMSKIYISGRSTQLHVSPLVKYYLNGTQFHARLVDALSHPVCGKIVSVILQNTTYNCTTDENGWITLNIDLLPGRYDVECQYYGDFEMENSFNRTRIIVLPTVSGSDEVKWYGDSPYLTISFVDGQGNPINNTPFIIGIDGKNYYALTNDDGKFLFDLNLNPGNHFISVINPYDGFYASYDLAVLSTVFADDLVKVINSDSYYSVSFFDTNGTSLANRDVDIIINGYRYVYRTDESGLLILPLNLRPGKYLVTAINPATGQYVENNVEILPSICENDDVVMYFRSGQTYKVRIIGNDGKAVGMDESVAFKVNGKSYNVKTNAKGYAVFKIKLKPGSYVITASYNGYSVANKITVKPVLTAKDISRKKSKVIRFKAKLVSGAGKALKGKKITFKVKGKKYVAKTNKKGFATIKIKNLDVGKYKIKTNYAKSKITNWIVIKK